jgi:hypothetical protein
MTTPLPEYISHKQMKAMGFGEAAIRHLKLACGVTKIGGLYFVRRDRLEAELAKREVRAS